MQRRLRAPDHAGVWAGYGAGLRAYAAGPLAGVTPWQAACREAGRATPCGHVSGRDRRRPPERAGDGSHERGQGASAPPAQNVSSSLSPAHKLTLDRAIGSMTPAASPTTRRAHPIATGRGGRSGRRRRGTEIGRGAADIQGVRARAGRRWSVSRLCGTALSIAPSAMAVGSYGTEPPCAGALRTAGDAEPVAAPMWASANGRPRAVRGRELRERSWPERAPLLRLRAAQRVPR
jgi:hypothetical protein